MAEKLHRNYNWLRSEVICQLLTVLPLGNAFNCPAKCERNKLYF